jgi:hypothetical protein
MPPVRFRLPAAWFSGEAVLGGQQAVMTAAARQAHEAQNSIKASNYSPSEFRAQGEIRNKTVTAAKQQSRHQHGKSC